MAQQPLSSVPAAEARGRGRRRSHLLSNLLIAAGVILLLVAAGMWGMSRWRYYKQDEVNRKLATYATVYDTAEADGPQAPEVDWAGLKAVNAEVVGWLQIPGTTINYPVYQHSDNEYYLRHSAETGEWTIGGQLFLDADAKAPGMVDEQSIIYGHHLLDGSMFEQIAAMDEQARFDEIDTVWYVTEEAAWECEPLLLYYTQPDDQNVRRFRFDEVAVDENGNDTGVDLSTLEEGQTVLVRDATDAEREAAFHTYLEGLLAKSVTRRSDAAEIISGAKHVLSMSTCNYYDGYGRTILVCVPKAEAAAALGKS